MAQVRQSIPDWSLANPMYVGAVVTFYEVSVLGVKTATKATLYDSQTGVGTLLNPQVLDSDGKFAAPVYVAIPVIADVVGANGVADHSTGVIGRIGEYFASVVWDPPSLAAGAWTSTPVALAEAIVGDFAVASFSNPNGLVVLVAQVTAAGVVTVAAGNVSAGVLDLASGTLRVRVFKV